MHMAHDENDDLGTLGSIEPTGDSPEQRAEARIKGFLGEACPECGNFTLVQVGAGCKCETCGNTIGKPTWELKDFIDAALAERWEFVDANIKHLVTPACIVWAMREGGLEHSDPNVRDLAATIIQHCGTGLSPELALRVAGMIKDDPNPYVRYRLAFALFNRGDRSDLIRTTIQEAQTDSAVKSDADECMARWT